MQKQKLHFFVGSTKTYCHLRYTHNSPFYVVYSNQKLWRQKISVKYDNYDWICRIWITLKVKYWMKTETCLIFYCWIRKPVLLSKIHLYICQVSILCTCAGKCEYRKRLSNMTISPYMNCNINPIRIIVFFRRCSFLLKPTLSIIELLFSWYWACNSPASNGQFISAAANHDLHASSAFITTRWHRYLKVKIGFLFLKKNRLT